MREARWRNEKKTMRKIIGITGPYCAGKNYISGILERRGIPVLDVDKLGHKVIEKERDSLVSRFGKDILDSGGFIDRKLLGVKVFGKPGELASLEAIIHPAVNHEISEWVESQSSDVCVVNAALLHRTSVFSSLDAIIVVKTFFLVRLLRAKKRDRLPFKVLLKRFGSQRDFVSQYSEGKADIYKVKNSFFSGFSQQRLEKKLDTILSLVLGNK